MNILLQKLATTLGLPISTNLIDSIISEYCNDLRFTENRIVDLDAIATNLKVTDIRYADLPCDGLLIPQGNEKYQIMINMYRSTTRQRFSLAHEIAHIIINKILPETRELKTRTGEHIVPCNKDEEELSDMLAARLIMPTKEMECITNPIESVNADILLDITRDFGVSITSASIRLQDFFNCDFAVFLLRGAFADRRFESMILKNFFQSPLRCYSRKYYGLQTEDVDVVKRILKGWFKEEQYRKRELNSHFSPIDSSWTKLLAVSSR